MASGVQTCYRRVCSSTPGHWGLGNPALTLSRRRCRTIPYTSSDISCFPTMLLFPRPFGSRWGGRLRVMPWTPASSGSNSLRAWHGAQFPFIRLKHLKGRVKDPSAVVEPAGCTILHRRRCPCGEEQPTRLPSSWCKSSHVSCPDQTCSDTTSRGG